MTLESWRLEYTLADLRDSKTECNYDKKYIGTNRESNLRLMKKGGGTLLHKTPFVLWCTRTLVSF